MIQGEAIVAQYYKQSLITGNKKSIFTWLQGCGNMEMFFLLVLGQVIWKNLLVRTKSYLSWFFLNIWYLHSSWFMIMSVRVNFSVLPFDQWQRSLYIIEINWTCFIWSITLLRKTSDIVLKLTQVLLHKWSLPKWRPFMWSVNGRMFWDTT